MSHMEVHPYIFGGADISEKLFKDWCLLNSQPTILFLTYFYKIAILSKGCKPDNTESQNSLKLSFTNIRGLSSNFGEYQSFLEANSPGILALFETNLDDSICSRNFFFRMYLPLIQNVSVTDMHGLVVYVKKELPFTRDLSLENSAYCYWLYVVQYFAYFFSR